MQANEVVELNIPAKPEYVGVVRLLISGLASRLGFSFDEIEDIKVAVAEACTNAVTHAYQEQEGSIRIKCLTYPNRLEIVVIDHGQRFEVNQIKRHPSPISTKTDIQTLYEGGLGLYLIETLMDRVEIQKKDGIMIQMTKFKEVESNDRPVQTSSS
ncbi:putative anti-sigma regulatory factor, serine/threonine protein kinase [Caldalkalibacillus thermarum TA2.A1]|uniref:Serine-protein kinase RsbW n=1 Tax=Caldalkalibacillus thermarum (strain TA2.A1) TaxID=986075 RepID=F5L790_CALTT|nr:anti-sigma B factor RsbW [Caldalkalibacillus thermarum]EGL82811.1 putative anti-sigma regulatory factor, serine/threonine protein kinase [Caldalkalibacillus thermarum TA2.A1]QZT34555.1 anti-sigma B factor RsbW [Caldalkalibacillus thermarum TA2.A1]